MQVGVVYNLKHAEQSRSAAPDDQAEYDSMDTVLAIERALKRQGCRTILLEADEELPEKLRKNRPDFVFNIAEGRGGRAREAQVPALLTLFDIPYTGSDETTLCIALDKALTKRLLATYRIPTPRYRIFEPGMRIRTSGLRFPVIVKPNAEGSSKGIADVCIAENAVELKSLVEQNLTLYGGSVLVEEYIHGREFTVGLLGNEPDWEILPLVEIDHTVLPPGANPIYGYEAKWVWDDPARPLAIHVCPAPATPELAGAIRALALRVARVMRLRDWCRMDVRLDAAGAPKIIELNPLPGILPDPRDNSALPAAARAAGYNYNDLILRVAQIALKRCGLAQ